MMLRQLASCWKEKEVALILHSLHHYKFQISQKYKGKNKTINVVEVYMNNFINFGCKRYFTAWNPEARKGGNRQLSLH